MTNNSNGLSISLSLAEPKKKPANRIAMACLECGKRFSVALRNMDPDCPKCGGVDLDVL